MCTLLAGQQAVFAYLFNATEPSLLVLVVFAQMAVAT